MTTVILWVNNAEQPYDHGGVVEYIDGYLEATYGEGMLTRVDHRGGGDARGEGYVYLFTARDLDVTEFVDVVHNAPWKHQGTSTLMIHCPGWDAPHVYATGDPIPLRQA